MENDDARDKTYNPDSESESEPEVVVCKSIGKRPVKKSMGMYHKVICYLRLTDIN